MRRLKVWSPTIQRPTKDIFIKLTALDQGDMLLNVVDYKGSLIATLLYLGPRGVSAPGYAKTELESRGYDTSFAQWNEDGAMVLTTA